MLNLLTLWGVAVDWRCLPEVNFHASDMLIGTLGPHRRLDSGRRRGPVVAFAAAPFLDPQVWHWADHRGCVL